MSSRADYSAQGQDLWFATPLSEIEFSQCRKCSPSYRALPKDYPKLQCTERSDEECKVLNDIWVSIPIGSEESTSFKVRKVCVQYSVSTYIFSFNMTIVSHFFVSFLCST